MKGRANRCLWRVATPDGNDVTLGDRRADFDSSVQKEEFVPFSAAFVIILGNSQSASWLFAASTLWTVQQVEQHFASTRSLLLVQHVLHQVEPSPQHRDYGPRHCVCIGGVCSAETSDGF